MAVLFDFQGNYSAARIFPLSLFTEESDMQTFIMLTRLAHSALGNPKELEALEKQVMDRISGQCPKVKWVASYAILGPHDYLDVFQAPDTQTAMQVSAIVRSFGHANTEIWGAAEWKRFKKMIRNLPAAAA